MKISVQRDVYKKIDPKLRVALIKLVNIDNKTNLQESINLLKDAEDYIRLTYNKENIKNHYLIDSWSILQRRLGKKARKHHSSVERVFDHVLSKKTLSSKNVLDNLINYFSLKNVIPVSIDDHDKLVGDILFKVSRGTEKAGRKKIENNVLIYQDSARKDRVLGVKLDLWKSSRTKLSVNTKSALIHVEVLPPFSNKQLNSILDDMIGLINSFTNAKCSKVILTEKNDMIEW
ncbi:hypothetical protein HN385_02605 [archaeon]|jgi:DNA/RNA-binding domain of Phe-tRNA-synthetase-like protein|nr:hypothetical protein [archaeon]MBT3450641.1 hypothetical protein [archaeon]MBT6868779.1 hypothetical protein [archaeon]MBT7193000.1 hypothetical protein [archaeon]MBT7380966.1 hypothetical protein [archaeon]